jgi:hypothetical protein
MGILNNALGINLTDNDPLIYNPFNESNGNNFSSPPVPQGYFLELTSPLAPFTLLSGEYMTLL